MIEIRRYVTAHGKDVFGEWLRKLRDRQAQARILARLARLETENFGDCRALSRGIWELRIDYGPGYRVYFAMIERTCVLLLVGGDKRSQSRDIGKAVERLLDYNRRTSGDAK